MTHTDHGTVAPAPGIGDGPPDHLVSGLLDLLGSHARALDALLSVSRIEWCEEVSTACVECVEHPRLLLNPAFVRTWCHSTERLAALVLHELLHIVLGHTRLYPRPTPLHNIAFDAIINRLVLECLDPKSPREPYAALFTAFYAADATPAFILRPPPGWPDEPDWNASVGAHTALRTVHRRLYDTSWGNGRKTFADVTYGDILAAIRAASRTTPQAAGAGDTGRGAADLPLLGSHGVTERERAILDLGRDTEAAAQLVQPLTELTGPLQGAGQALLRSRLPSVRQSRPFDEALQQLLQRAVRPDDGRVTRWTRTARTAIVPHPLQDRRAATRRSLARTFGAPAPLLFDGVLEDRRPARESLTIYVDVSGSMLGVLPRLHAALRALHTRIAPRLYWFSTKVVTATPVDLERGTVHGTGGTAVTCVLRHALTHTPLGTPLLVITDGYLEIVSAKTVAEVRRSGLRVHLGVIGSGPLHLDQSWVASSVRLPNP